MLQSAGFKLSDNLIVNESFVVTKDDKDYNFVKTGQLAPPRQVFKTDFKRLPKTMIYPASQYAPADMSYKGSKPGLTKYADQKYFDNMDECLRGFVDYFELDISSNDLYSQVMNHFKEVYGGLAAYLENAQTLDEVIEFMLYDLSGEKRGNTSCGYGIPYKRPEFVQMIEEVKKIYLLEEFPFRPVSTSQSKDEIRLKSKDTRSIMVPQIFLYIICIKYLGGCYKFMKNNKFTTPITFGADLTNFYWEETFSDFDKKKKVQTTDMRKQDSRMNEMFVVFIRRFLVLMSPSTHRRAIDWIFESGYLSKNVVTSSGDVFHVRNGELSGFPLTILMNSWYTHFFYTLTHIVHKLKRKCSCRLTLKVLGDDAATQDCSESNDEYEEVCKYFNHEITGDVNSFENMDYLSMSFSSHKGGLLPYYNNVEKAYGALRYYNGDMEDYYNKLCSYRSLTYFSPKNTPARKLCNLVTKYIHFVTKEYHIQYTDAYKSESELLNDRLGLQSAQGGLKYCNMAGEIKKREQKKNTVANRVHQLEQKMIKQENKTKSMTKRMQDGESALTQPQKNKVFDFCKHISTGDTPFKIPRAIPQYTTSMAYGGEGRFNNEEVKYGCVILDPSQPDRAVQTSLKGDGLAPNRYMQPVVFAAAHTQQVMVYYFANPMFIGAVGSQALQCPKILEGTQSEAIIVNNEIITGFKAYYEDITIPANQNIQYDAIFGTFGGATNTNQLQIADATGNILQTADLNFSSTMVTVANAGDIAFRIQRFAYSTNQFYIRMNFPFTGNTDPEYTALSEPLWNYTQARGAESYDDASVARAINAASLWLHSVNTQYSTGRLYYGIVQEPGLARSMKPDDLYNYMAKKLFYKRTADLNDGAFVTWIPQKKQDMFFHKANTVPKTNCIVMVWENNGVDDVANSLTIDPRVVYEYTTEEQLIKSTLTRGNLMKLTAAYHTWLLVNEDYTQDNETHLKRIGASIRKFVKSPELQHIVKTVGPMLLTSALAAI